MKPLVLLAAIAALLMLPAMVAGQAITAPGDVWVRALGPPVDTAPRTTGWDSPAAAGQPQTPGYTIDCGPSGCKRCPNPAICRIENEGKAIGSGAVVDVAGNTAWVVSCHHLFDKGIGKRVTCTFPNGKRFTASSDVPRDKFGEDLSVLMIPNPGVEPIAVAEAGPRVGQTAVSCGFDGRTGRYQTNTGRVVRIEGSDFWIPGLAHEGNSGGPVLDSQGRLIGVLYGTTSEKGLRQGHPQEVFATSSVTADAFLTRVGRYFLPYRNGVDGRLNSLQQQVNQNRQQGGQVPQVIVQPSAVQPPVDLSPLAARVAANEQAIAAIRTTAEGAETTVAAALDEESSGGLMSRLKGRIEEAKAAGAEGTREVAKAVVMTALKSFLWPWGAIVAAVAGYGYWDLRKRRTTGDPLLVEKLHTTVAGLQGKVETLAERTRNTVDDRVTGAVSHGHDWLGDAIVRLADRYAPKPPTPPAA